MHLSPMDSLTSQRQSFGRRLYLSPLVLIVSSDISMTEEDIKMRKTCLIIYADRHMTTACTALALRGEVVT